MTTRQRADYVWPFDAGALIARALAEHSDETAIVCNGRSQTFGELEARARRLASALRGLGVEPGDRVAVLLWNRLEYPEIDVALALGGFVRVALNVRLAAEDVEYIVGDADARVLISEAACDDAAQQVAEAAGVHWVRIAEAADEKANALGYEALLSTGSATARFERVPPSRPAWLSYTSGTTGKPKGVVLSHSALVQVTFNIMIELGPIAPGRSILLPQPLSHGAGYFVLAYLAAGGTTHVMSRFDPEHAIRLSAEHRISTFKCVPTMLSSLLDVERPVAFESIVFGAAPMSLPELERGLDRYGPILVQLYGQSEAPITITVLHKADLAKPGTQRSSAGRPWRNVSVDVVDADGNSVDDGEIGEVVVAGAHLMDGYLGLPELTSEVLHDGWLRTRDMAVRDADGFIYLRGRRDEMIISGGFNISPKEVEEVIDWHPAVKECLVVGVPDARWGQAIQVHVVRNPGTTVAAEELVEFSKPRLGFRRPRSVIFVDELPRSAYGKIDRAAHALNLNAHGTADWNGASKRS